MFGVKIAALWGKDMGSLGQRHRVFGCKTPGVSGQNPWGFASASKSDAD